jgi:hypothetical protein
MILTFIILKTQRKEIIKENLIITSAHHFHVRNAMFDTMCYFHGCFG